MTKTIEGVSFVEWSATCKAEKTYALVCGSLREEYRLPDGTLVEKAIAKRRKKGEVGIKVTIRRPALLSYRNIELAKKYAGYVRLMPEAKNNEIEFCFRGDDAMNKAWDFVSDNSKVFINMREE